MNKLFGENYQFDNLQGKRHKIILSTFRFTKNLLEENHLDNLQGKRHKIILLTFRFTKNLLEDIQ